MNNRKFHVATLSELMLGKAMTIQLRRFLLPLVASNYDFIILMSRKMYSLFRIFFDENFKKFFSSDAIDIIGNRFSGKTVLVVDDTMIHGRTLEAAKKRILRYSAKQVDFQVFIKEEYSEAAPPIDDVFADAGECFSFTKPEWRSFSSNLINLFEISLTPYRRALPYMYLQADSTQREQFITALRERRYTVVSDMVETRPQGVKATSMYVTCPLSQQTSQYCKSVVLKLSWSEKIPDNMLITPYVFMDNILLSDVADILLSIISEDHLCTFPSDQGRLLQYLTAFQELYALQETIAHLGIEYELNTSDYCFAFARSEFPQIKAYPLLFSLSNSKKDIDYVTILGSYLDSISTEKGIPFSLEQFFMYAGIIDDANVLLCQERTCFIMLSQCLKQVETFVDYVKLLSKGIAAMSYQTFESGEHLCPCLAPGEMAFSYAVDNYPDIQSTMYVFSGISSERNVSKDRYNEMYQKLFTHLIQDYPNLENELNVVIKFCCTRLSELTGIKKKLPQEKAVQIAARYVSECIPSLKRSGQNITNEVIDFLQNYV